MYVLSISSLSEVKMVLYLQVLLSHYAENRFTNHSDRSTKLPPTPNPFARATTSLFQWPCIRRNDCRESLLPRSLMYIPTRCTHEKKKFIFLLLRHTHTYINIRQKICSKIERKTKETHKCTHWQTITPDACTRTGMHRFLLKLRLSFTFVPFRWHYIRPISIYTRPILFPQRN